MPGAAAAEAGLLFRRALVRLALGDEAAISSALPILTPPSCGAEFRVADCERPSPAWVLAKPDVLVSSDQASSVRGIWGRWRGTMAETSPGEISTRGRRRNQTPKRGARGVLVPEIRKVRQPGSYRDAQLPPQGR
ncbi:hypothetical protein HYQ44_011251 [Verticillium longisporum]|nr:hypothetical protein HYQ44_011251 [Verticillium longisporum]